MHLEATIKGQIISAFKDLFSQELAEDSFQLQPTRKEFPGSYTFVTFPYLKVSGKNPEETGKMIGDYLVGQQAAVSGYNVVKGFLNLEVADHVWINMLKEQLSQQNYGSLPANGQKVMVEYSSPNTNKPLHLGHMRNNFLGFSISEILQANGYEVQKVNLVNDRGIHICKSMIAYQRYGNGETPQSSGLKGDHLIGKYYVEFDKAFRKEVADLVAKGIEEEHAKKQAPILLEAQDMLLKWEEGDAEIVGLWKKLNDWVYEGFDATYKRMGVDFHQFYYESNTYLLGKDIVEEGLSKNVFFKKDNGSVWIDLSDEGLDEKLVLRADGTSVYITQDLGTADLKYNDYPFDKSIYVVGNEQDYHFNVLFKILKKLGRPYAEGMYHLSYGMVDLPTGRMKSREGTVVDADDLIQEMVDTAEKTTKELGKIDGFSEEEAKNLYEMLALGALKYFLLKVDPKKRMVFNPEESIEFQGNTGPFIQYTHARIAAILRKAKQIGANYQSADLNSDTLLAAERDVVFTLSLYENKLREAARDYNPAVIAQYAYDLAKDYNRFYTELSIFNEEDPVKMHLRLLMSEAVAHVLRKAMGLLGVSMPERM